MSLRVRLIFIAAFLGSVLMAAAMLFFFYPEVLRTRVLVPVIEAYFMGRYYLEFVPQLYLWLIPPLVVVLIAGHRFVRWSKQERAPFAVQPSSISPGEGELARLSHQIRRAHHSRFARVRLSRTLIEISARLIASKEGTTLLQARKLLAEGYWRTHSSVHLFLTPRRHYTTRQSGDGFWDSLSETIKHLEEFDNNV